MPASEILRPEVEFGMINVLAKLIEALAKMDPNKPEGVVLRAMVKNYVTPETQAQLASGNPVSPVKPDEFKTPQFKEAVKVLHQKVTFLFFDFMTNFVLFFSIKTILRSETRWRA